MITDGNPEDPYSGEVTTVARHVPLNKRRAMIYIIALMVAVAALSAAVAVTADRSANGGASPETISEFLELGVTTTQSNITLEDGADRRLPSETAVASFKRDVASSDSEASSGGQRDLSYCPVRASALGCAYSASYAARLCGAALGRAGCSTYRCNIYAWTPYYSYVKRCWAVKCACN